MHVIRDEEWSNTKSVTRIEMEGKSGRKRPRRGWIDGVDEEWEEDQERWRAVIA